MSGPVFLGGERLCLRLVYPENYEFMIQNLNNPRIRHQGYESVRTPVSSHDIAVKRDAEDYHMFLACRDESPVGSVSLKDIDLRGAQGRSRVLDLARRAREWLRHGSGRPLSHACL